MFESSKDDVFSKIILSKEGNDYGTTIISQAIDKFEDETEPRKKELYRDTINLLLSYVSFEGIQHYIKNDIYKELLIYMKANPDSFKTYIDDCYSGFLDRLLVIIEKVFLK